MLISYDIDGTLRNYDGSPNWQIIELAKSDIESGHNVICITRRTEDSTYYGIHSEDLKKWINKHLGKEIVIYFTNLEYKHKAIKFLGVEFHTDDDIMDIELIQRNCPKCGTRHIESGNGNLLIISNEEK